MRSFESQAAVVEELEIGDVPPKECGRGLEMELEKVFEGGVQRKI
jgi:hypothetical protein